MLPVTIFDTAHRPSHAEPRGAVRVFHQDLHPARGGGGGQFLAVNL